MSPRDGWLEPARSGRAGNPACQTEGPSGPVPRKGHTVPVTVAGSPLRQSWRRSSPCVGPHASADPSGLAGLSPERRVAGTPSALDEAAEIQRVKPRVRAALSRERGTPVPVTVSGSPLPSELEKKQSVRSTARLSWSERLAGLSPRETGGWNPSALWTSRGNPACQTEGPSGPVPRKGHTVPVTVAGSPLRQSWRRSSPCVRPHASELIRAINLRLLIQETFCSLCWCDEFRVTVPRHRNMHRICRMI